MTMITPSYLGETIEYSSLHACRSTLEDPSHRGFWKRDDSTSEMYRVRQCGVLLAMHSIVRHAAPQIRNRQRIYVRIGSRTTPQSSMTVR